MKLKTLQIQSVIFKNDRDSLLKAIKAVKNAIRVFNEGEAHLDVKLVYGDASPEAVLKGEDIKLIQELAKGTFEFDYIPFGFNSGTAKGHNILGEKCKSEYLMIMNPDIILEPGCLRELFLPMENKEVGMVEARQTPLEHAKVYNIDTGETDWASTACTIIRSEIFKEIKGFDADTFFMYCDDLDFSWRLRLADYKVIYQPSAVVYHAKNLTVNGKWQPTRAEVYYSAEAAILLSYKWSNTERTEQLVSQFMRCGCEAEKKAATEFKKRMEENRLPEQIDPEHRIAQFIGDEYCQMRFHF